MLRTHTPLFIPIPNRVAMSGPDLIGRDAAVEALVQGLKGGQAGQAAGPYCVLRGRAGTGKTEVGRAAARRLLQEYPDGRIYLQVQDPHNSDPSLYGILETVVHILDPLARVSSDPDLLQQQYRSCLDGKRILIILDDLPAIRDLDRLLPPSSCALLITTEQDLDLPHAVQVSLTGLSGEASRGLLRSLCPRTGESAGILSRLCQHLPVNLSLAAGYLNHFPEIEAGDFISALQERLERSPDAQENAAETLLTCILDPLSAGERTLFSQLSVFTDGFSLDLAAQLSEPESGEALQAHLDTFASLKLVTREENPVRFRLQPSILRPATKRLGDAPHIWHRLAGAYTAWLRESTTLANAGADEYLLSVQMFDEHKGTIRDILRHLAAHPSKAQDPYLLEFFDFVSLFGKDRFAPEPELSAWLQAMREAAVRLNDRARLGAISSLLSDLRPGSGEARTRRAGSGPVEQVRTGAPAPSPDPMPLVLEEFSSKKTKIVLTGFMGTGKTTVGKLLADYLQYQFLDTDELIESRNNRTISEIFQDLGEEAFRDMERAVVREIAGLDGVVISTGGRLMLDPVNVNALSDNSRVLCLVATPDEILNRVADDQEHKRPLLSVPNPKERIVELLQERDDKYRRFPQIATDEKQPTDIARGLVEFINTSPRSLTVDNPQNSYEYVVGAGLLPFIRQLTGLQGQAVIITDDRVNELYGPSCASTGQIIEIPSGRGNKSLVTVQSVYDRLIDLGFDRSGTIISLGGSVVGDIAGYVAATYMRGVNLVQCPTSLIAMVDTSVGGKTSIDLPQGKNMIGVYKQPSKVIADVATLQTLQQVDFASGMAEVIKHGLLAASDLLEQVEQGYWAKNWDRSPSYIGELQRLVAQAIQVKIKFVQSDPFEGGRRSILNLGHTFAYAIEQVSHNAHRHGEAVSMGLVAASNLSARLGFCDGSLQERIESILESVHLPTRIPTAISPEALLRAMQHDKKKRAGQLRLILLRGIGQAFVSDEVSNTEILATLSALSDRA